MTCDRCQHMKRIREALAPCQACDCCAHHGRSHVQATDFTLTKAIDGDGCSRKDGQAFAYVPADGRRSVVASLSPEDEDRLRKAMASLFSLDPLDLLLVQHLFQGGRLSTFAQLTQRVARRIAAYHGEPRAQAHAAKVRVSKAFPVIAPVLQQLVDMGGTSVLSDGGGVTCA